MNLSTTNVFDKIQIAHKAGKRLIVNEGGTSSSKTHSSVQFLSLIAMYSIKRLLISIVSETVPHLKRGCIRDFQNIMAEDFDEKAWNRTDSIYTFPNKNQIEFFSADDSSKLRGGRRDILFVNEANNITKESFDELDVRTRILTLIDHNPVAEYWAHELKNEPHVEWIHSTYLDTVHLLEESVVFNIRSRRLRDPNWWRVYGLGLVGKLEGLIHPEFKQISELPEGGNEIFGLDFGFSQDPCALVQNRIIGDAVYSKELIYERGMTNARIIKRFERLGIRRGHDVIIADCEDPKSIQEIHEAGYDIRPCIKGKDSVWYGIQRVNQYRQYWTKDSLNGIKEQRNYQWEKDKDGKFTDKPIDEWNHLLDSRRYSIGTEPAAKVLPNYNGLGGETSHYRKFDLKWSMRMIPKHTCMHYGAMSLGDDMGLWISAGIWDNAAGLLFLYWEHYTETPVAKEVVELCGMQMHLDEFHFERFLGNKKIMDLDRKALSKVFNAEFVKKVKNQNIKLREPRRYEEFGSVALMNELVDEKRLYVHEGCGDTNQELSNWAIQPMPKKNQSTEKAVGRLIVKGYRENILMILSELRRDPRFEQRVKVPPYAPDYRKAPELGVPSTGI